MDLQHCEIDLCPETRHLKHFHSFDLSVQLTHSLRRDVIRQAYFSSLSVVLLYFKSSSPILCSVYCWAVIRFY